MKYGQLKQYNMKNIFLEESYPKCGGETILRHFSKKSKLSISLDQFAYHLILPYTKLLQKTKRGLELVSLLYFLHDS